jgi:hypothetical protein
MRPTKGGAVRIRIALTTAVAVLISAVSFALFSSTPASAREIRHEAVSQHKYVHHQPKPIHHRSKLIDHTRAQDSARLVALGQATQAAKLATFYNAVTLHDEETYLQEIAFYKDVAFYNGLSKEEAFYNGLQQEEAQQAAAAQAAAAQAAAAQAAAAQAAAAATATAGGGSDATSTDTADWACIREHESNDNYSEPGGGAYQFELGTWQSLTGLPDPAEDYPPSVQDAAALQLYAQRGWEPWTTRFVCGL